MHRKPLILTALSVLAVAPALAAGPDTTRHQAQIDQIVKEISPTRIEG